jgi:aspartate ammonia-lyase
VSFNEKEKKDSYSLIKPEDRKRIAQSANDLYLERVDKIEEKNEAIKKLKF